MWVRHEVHLTKLDILFEGTNIKIFTSYRVDIDADYEQSPLPLSEAFMVKGILSSSIEANINLVGSISINDKAQLQIEANKDETKIEFTRILLPSNIDALDILKVTKTKNFFTKKLLEEPINKYIFQEVQRQISKKQIDLQLAQKIQNLVSENSNPLALSKDLWLVPHAKKISLSQLNGQGALCSNTLTINVGIVAQPKLITSVAQPLSQPETSIPIVCEAINPKVYLYPSLNIKYTFAEQAIQTKLQSIIKQKYSDYIYSINNVKIYPSNTKLIVSMDLVDKEKSEKIITFYLSGTPKLNHKNMSVSLEEFEYTLETKNYLIKVADWMLDDKIKSIIQSKAIFSYKEEFNKLSNKLSTIEHQSNKKIITGKIKLEGVQNIFLSKDSIVVHALATGDLSYKINLRK